MILFLLGYRKLVSPYLPGACRFYPSCSAYAVEAVRRHGVWWGTFLTAGRLLRCQPLHPGGYDPVPPASRARSSHLPVRIPWE